MLAGVFPLGVHHIEHSGNPLGHLSTPRGFRREHNRRKQVIVAFFSFPPPPTPPPPPLVLAIRNFECGFLPSPLLGGASFHWSVTDVGLK